MPDLHLAEAWSSWGQLNETTRNALVKYGKHQVTGLTLIRTPVTDWLRRVVDLLSFGQLGKLIARHFDAVFHLALIIRLHDGTLLLTEKRPHIHVGLLPSDAVKEDTKQLVCSAYKQVLTLGQIMAKAQRQMGPKFLTYEPITNNCQYYVMNVLTAAAAIDSPTHEFIIQPISQLLQYEMKHQLMNQGISLGVWLLFLKSINGLYEAHQAGVQAGGLAELKRRYERVIRRFHEYDGYEQDVTDMDDYQQWNLVRREFEKELEDRGVDVDQLLGEIYTKLDTEDESYERGAGVSPCGCGVSPCGCGVSFS